MQRGGWYSWLFWGIVAIFYLYEFFVRVTPNVILPQLGRDLDADAASLGSAMAFYLWIYAPSQLIVGWLFDRFGTKYLVSSAAIICGVGCVVFAMAKSLAFAGVARGLIGFGSSFAFVGAIYVATVWFPPARLALIAGITTSVGMIGEIAGQVPVAVLVDEYSWQKVVLWTGLIGGVLGLLMMVVIPRRPSWFSATVAAHETEEVGLFSSLRTVLSNPQMWLIGFVSAVVYLPLSVLAALWGTTSLEVMGDLGQRQASLAISMLAVGWLVGCPIVGLLSDRFRNRRIFLLMGCVGGLVTTSLLLFVGSFSYPVLMIILLVCGLLTSSQAITFAMCMEVNPRRFRATSTAICNFLVMIIAATLQVGIGWILDWRAGEHTSASVAAVKAPSTHPSAAHVAAQVQHSDAFASLTTIDFQWALATIPILYVVAIVLIFLIKETHARNIVDPAPMPPTVGAS